MEDEWFQTTLGAITEQAGYGLVDGPFGSNLPTSCYTEDGIPVIRGSNLTLGSSRFRGDEFVFVSSETAERLKRSLCRPLDIVFTMKGTLGQTGLVPEGTDFDEFLLSSNQMKLTVDQRVADPLFVYYFVSSPESTAKIIRDSEATGVPKTNVTYLREFPITLPPLAEQRAIAHILGTLDDKIELNRRMNQTLEQIAAALFKSWFVDFDPVRAKADGRQPEGIDAETAALFPDRLAESMLGEIPEGWQASTVGDEFNVTMGQSPPGDTYNVTGDGLPFYQGRVDFGFRYPGRRVYCDAPTRLAAEGAALLSVRAPVGSLNVAIEPCAIGRGVAALHHTSGGSSYAYYSLMAMSPRFAPFNGEGTVFGSISRGDLLRLPSLAPAADVVHAFERAASPLDARIRLNELQGRTLTELRDILLPRLISGELRVPTDVLDEEAVQMQSQVEEALVQSHF